MAALCNATAVLDGEGIRSTLRLAAHPVNAPAQELLELLEKLVLRYFVFVSVTFLVFPADSLFPPSVEFPCCDLQLTRLMF